MISYSTSANADPAVSAFVVAPELFTPAEKALFVKSFNQRSRLDLTSGKSCDGALGRTKLIDASPVGRTITALSVTHPIVYSRRSKPSPRPLDDAFDSIYLRRTWVVWRRVNGVSGGLWPRNHADTQEML